MNDRRSYELSVLNDVARALNASVDLPALLAGALEKAAELLGLRTGWVLLFDETSGEPYVAAAQNLPPGLGQEPLFTAGWCYCLESFRDGEFDDAANVGVVYCSRLRRPGVGRPASSTTPASRSRCLTTRAGSGGSGCSTWQARSGASSTRTSLASSTRSATCSAWPWNGRACTRAGWRRSRRRSATASPARSTTPSPRTSRPSPSSSKPPRRCGRTEGDGARPTECLGRARSGPEGLDETRRSVLDLRAAPLEGRTLPAALAALAARAMEANGGEAPAVTFEGAPGTPLPPAVKVGLYRIAQEALQNALRHANAAHVSIRLESSPDRVRLTVEDDGRGFEMTGATASRFGLVGMRERARLLGGSFQIESSPGAGTRITAEVPLTASRIRK